MTEWLKKHPNFVKVVEHNSTECYSFKGEKGVYELYKTKTFDPKNNYPIDWNAPSQIFEAPDFFKKLYVKLFKEYYQENKLRFLTHHTRMYLPLLIRAYALSIKESISFWNHFSDLDIPIEKEILPVKTKQQLIGLKTYLAFFGYELKIVKEADQTISITIN